MLQMLIKYTKIISEYYATKTNRAAHAARLSLGLLTELYYLVRKSGCRKSPKDASGKRYYFKSFAHPHICKSKHLLKLVHRILAFQYRVSHQEFIYLTCALTALGYRPYHQ